MTNPHIEHSPEVIANRVVVSWTWWIASIDWIIVWLVGAYLTAALMAAAPSDLLFFFFPDLFPMEFAWARYVIIWICAPMLSTWLLIKWMAWKGISLSSPALPLPKRPWFAAGLTMAVVIAGLAIDYATMLAFPNQSSKDLEIFRYVLHSPMAYAMFFGAIVSAPVFEELSFRGYLQDIFAGTRLGYWGAAMLLSLVWSLSHWYSWIATVELFVSGLMFAFLRRQTGNISPCIAAHAIRNLISAIAITWLLPQV